ncbi:MAG: hypothetical protein VX412_01435 [Pseudomonadota bacterium]|nr:hypothetical protein [Pseudomonadota bacterium]
MAYILVDILPFKEGKTIEDALAYFEQVRPAMERNGLRRVDAPLRALKSLRGAQQADLVNLFETDDPETSMQGMAGDAEYQSHIALRDSIFDLENASIILTTKQA